MRRFIFALFALLFFLLIVLPVLTLVAVRLGGGRAQKGPTLVVWLTEENRAVTMPLDDYVTGVVAAEMPAGFELEALKAQAVAARTLAVRSMRSRGGTGCTAHPEADVCTGIEQGGQAWVSPGRARSRRPFWEGIWYWQKIRRAVNETAGLIITYQGQPIDAVYHSTAGDATENSEDVWGQAVPYLRSKPDPYDKDSPYYQDTVTLSWDEISRRLAGIAVVPGVTPAKSPAGPYIMVLQRSATGRIKLVQVGTKVYKGTDFRTALGLRSTNAVIEKTGNTFRFTTKGWGHGVGMSQYGANGMAKLGKNFREILQYYYTGVEITLIP